MTSFRHQLLSTSIVTYTQQKLSTAAKNGHRNGIGFAIQRTYAFASYNSNNDAHTQHTDGRNVPKLHSHHSVNHIFAVQRSVVYYTWILVAIIRAPHAIKHTIFHELMCCVRCPRPGYACKLECDSQILQSNRQKNMMELNAHNGSSHDPSSGDENEPSEPKNRKKKNSLSLPSHSISFVVQRINDNNVCSVFVYHFWMEIWNKKEKLLQRLSLGCEQSNEWVRERWQNIACVRFKRMAQGLIHAREHRMQQIAVCRAYRVQ